MSFKIVFLDISDRNKSQAEVNLKSRSNLKLNFLLSDHNLCTSKSVFLLLPDPT